jgi:hypothetical protein
MRRLGVSRFLSLLLHLLFSLVAFLLLLLFLHLPFVRVWFISGFYTHSLGAALGSVPDGVR